MPQTQDALELCEELLAAVDANPQARGPRAQLVGKAPALLRALAGELRSRREDGDTREDGDAYAEGRVSEVRMKPILHDDTTPAQLLRKGIG